MDFQLGLELSFARAAHNNVNVLHHVAYEEYPSSTSFVSTCSSTNMSIAMSTSSSTSSSDSCQHKRVSVVMMHNPYSFDAFTYMHRLSEDVSDESCECEGNESCDGSDCEEASPTSKTKKPKKKNVRCPNGHRAAKRLRYRKGQSHYSCNECSIRWKVDDPKRRPAFLAASE
jgi:hypothetical protein